MTAVNMMVQPKARAGFIISDGAHTAPDGTLIANSPKVIHSNGRFPWALAVTGNVKPEALLTELGAASPTSLKQLVKRMPGAMRAAIEQTSRDLRCPVADIDLAVTGVAWDFAAKRPAGFMVQSRPGVILSDAESFVWYDTAWSIAGAEIGDVATQLGRPCEVSDPASFDPERDGLALIERQRRAGITPTTPGIDRDQRNRIGGDVDLTIVTKAGVKVWCIHKFPDLVGERIAV